VLRKIEKGKEAEVKKKRYAQQKRRRGLNAETDKSHGGENHQHQDTIVVDDDATKTSKGGRARGTNTNNASLPTAKKPKGKCGTCKSASCAGGKKCPYQEEFGKPPTPDATEEVNEGASVAVVDIEFNEENDVCTVNEVGACARSYTNGTWKKETEEFKEVTKEKLGWWGLKNCKGLNEERKKSNQDFREVSEKLVGYIKKHKIKYLLAHGVVSSDARVMVKAGWAMGIDVIREWKEAGIKGVIDTMRIIPQHNIKALRHLDGKSVLSNGVLFKRASEGATMEARGLQEHRALDDSKATAEWVTGLPEVADVMFGRPRKPTAISIAALGAYYAQVRKHKEFLEGRLDA
jgi:DNA polymerase III epsilon subunit-like protein